MPTVAEKRRAFRRLHDKGCFVIPNPWDVGSARYLQHLGFKALASTSSGFAFSQGLTDGAVPLERIFRYLHEVAGATDIPLNADFEDGHAPDLAGLGANLRRCIDAGVAGLSIEDATSDKGHALYDFDTAVARVRAARTAIDHTGSDILLTARAEGFLRGRPDMADVIRRLRAFAEVGADCLYAPGIRTREQIVAVVDAVAPKPVNVLVGAAIGLTVAELAELGVRRISVGGALARSAWGGFMRAARQIAVGRFDAFAEAAPSADLAVFLRQDVEARDS
jgi:2-methylisocitrate lyase-like PEP mutase family enzyme